MHTLMILFVLCDLETRSIDFTLVFHQADLDDVFMELPVGFDLGLESRKHVIKLNKSLYNSKQATHNWFELLKCSEEDGGYDH